ncbi:MAG TPA: bifunctional glutamate N-acetyltransferase/amino-acid acetyltransferase ArgJ, partial [Gammaproteobacteria bacterium]|nr:bifunctional glutamate N-acetyltransferase/amino-acid acetyltransferase ArgJ [Gammaproteobacteria bacterium]
TGSNTAAVFTRNRFCAAPVTVAREHLQLGQPRALLINTGNANAGTGNQGLRDARQSCTVLARRLGCQEHQVLPFSTGVIGEPLPMDRFIAALDSLPARLHPDRWVDCARAIMTTDTEPKGVSRSLQLEGQRVTFTAIAKGSGMIRPDMATMLCFIATDLAMDKAMLNRLLRVATDASFNRITVDGDTSTNDACVMTATGVVPAPVLCGVDDPRYPVVENTLTSLLVELATLLIRDAEGASKFVTVQVSGAARPEDAREVAYCVAHSPLVKTAMAASDPNWGRILAAVGRAQAEQIEPDKISITINGLRIATAGCVDVTYSEARAQEALASQDITVSIDLGVGTGAFQVWTSDLTTEYVVINAGYRS